MPLRKNVVKNIKSRKTRDVNLVRFFVKKRNKFIMKKTIILLSALAVSLANAQEADSTKTKLIEEVKIDAYRFMNKTSENVSKIPLKNIENPQVYSSISNVILKKQIAMSMEDAMKNATGIIKLWDATGRPDGGSFFTSRGFPTTTKLRNSMVSVANDNVDMANVERIEVLKGPSATLFGSFATSYGGLINRITKKPFFHFKGEAEASYGSFNFYRGGADVNIPLNKEKTIATRLNFATKNQDSWQDRGFMKIYNIAPSFVYKPNDRFTLNIDAEISQSKGNSNGGNFIFFLNPSTINAGLSASLGSFGLPQASVDAIMSLAPKNYKEAFGTNRADELKIDYNRSNNSDELLLTNSANSFFANADYQISKHWKSQTNVIYAKNKSNGYQVFQYALPNYLGSLISSLLTTGAPDFGTPGSDDLARMMWRLNGEANTTHVQQNFLADYQFGKMRNRTVIGVDYTYFKNRYKYEYINGLLYNAVPYPYVFDVVKAQGESPNYNDLNLENAEKAFANNPVQNIYQYFNNNLFGSYINNVLNITDNIIVSAGLRYDHFKTNGRYNKDKDQFENGKTDSRWSPKLGLVVMPIKDKISLFANYQNSFTYKFGGDANGNPFVPENANQFETGVKVSTLNDKLAGSISYYDILVKNLVRPESGGGMFAYIQDRNQRSKGIEAEISANPTNGWMMLLGYGYNDSKFEGAKEDVNGLRPIGSGPKHTANFWTNYTFTSTLLKGFGAGFSMNYAGESYADNTKQDGKLIIPSYVVLGSSFSYDAPKFKIAIKINNLTNEKYWMGWTNMIPQMPRQIIGTLVYKF